MIKLSGGLTNELYLINNQKDGIKKLVRIYGKNTDNIIDRNTENLIMDEASKL